MSVSISILFLGSGDLSHFLITDTTAQLAKAEGKSLFENWPRRSDPEGVAAAIKETLCLSSTLEFDISIKLLIHSSTLVVFDIEINFSTWAENLESKFLID